MLLDLVISLCQMSQRISKCNGKAKTRQGSIAQQNVGFRTLSRLKQLRIVLANAVVMTSLFSAGGNSNSA